MMSWFQTNAIENVVLEMLPGEHMDVQEIKSKHGLPNSLWWEDYFQRNRKEKLVARLFWMEKESAEFLTHVNKTF